MPFTQYLYLDALIRNEEATAALYAVFAARWPKIPLWSRLRREEAAHADVLRALKQLLERQEAHFVRPPLNLDLVVRSEEWLRTIANDFLRQHPTPAQALQTARTVERTMLEQRFFKVVADDTPELKQEFEALHQHTEAHLRLLELTGAPPQNAENEPPG